MKLSDIQKKKRVIMPLIAALTAISSFTVGFASSSYVRNIDKTDYAFKHDQEVIGKWKTVDFVENISDFNPQEHQYQEELYLSEVVFVDQGKLLTSIQEGQLCEGNLSWTKGMIISKQEKTAGIYEIKEIDDKDYLFFEWKNGDYIFRNAKPSYYVLEKVDSKDYLDYKPTAKEDKIDYSFIDNPRMIGEWQSVDFVEKIDDFNPQAKSWVSDLFLKGFKINEGGEVLFTMMNSDREYAEKWTKDLIISEADKTASRCEIKEIDGEIYMFYEWKSGDYIYRGMDPMYYVLKKVK